MTPTNNTLLIDTREPEWMRQQVELAAKLEGLTVSQSELPFGDYVFCFDTYTVGVERKSVRDLLNTIGADRFRPQMAGILTSYTIPYLLIEDTIAESKDGYIITDGAETRWRASSVHGMLYYIQEQRIRIATSPSSRTTPKRLMHLYAHFRDTDHRDLTNDRLGVLHYKSVPGMEMLMGIPGIGWDASKKLLSHFGSVSEVCAATLQQLMTVEGIGPRKAEQIFQAFHNQYLGGLEKAG